MAPFAQKRLLAHHKPGYTTGRPSEYKPEYCEMVIQAMERGLSLTAFAGSIRVARETVYQWMQAHSEFSDAVARARGTRVLWWEQKLMRSRKGAETTASIFALRNADPTEWKDIRSVQHDHNVRVETLTDQQLFAIASGKALSDAGTIDAEYSEVPQANER
jgi:hypothetical protein